MSNYFFSMTRHCFQTWIICFHFVEWRAIVTCLSIASYGSLNPINFLEGWTIGFDLFLSGTPFDTQGDFINYARRLELAPNQVNVYFKMGVIGCLLLVLIGFNIALNSQGHMATSNFHRVWRSQLPLQVLFQSRVDTYLVTHYVKEL